MEGRLLTKEIINNFINHLRLDEKSANTIEKYARDVKAFAAYLNGNVVSKNLVIEYKQKLIADGYAVSSINSMLAAVNRLFDYLGWVDCKVKAIKIQQQIYCPENKELSKAEYLRLVEAAERNHNHRLNMILQTICGTGIRISELKFITVEAVKSGTVEVACKGKNRVIFIVKKLKKKLLRYAAEELSLLRNQESRSTAQTSGEKLKPYVNRLTSIRTRYFLIICDICLQERSTSWKRTSPNLPISLVTAVSIQRGYILSQQAVST